MERAHQVCVRLDTEERERLSRVAKHYAMNDAGVIRHLLWRADSAISAGARPPLVRPDVYAREKLGINDDELELLIKYKFLSGPPQKEEVDDWMANSFTRRSPKAVLKTLAQSEAAIRRNKPQ
jgi:hypothetical protein